MHIYIFNLFFGLSLIVILLYFASHHVKSYWHKNFIFIPISTILIKFVFVIFFYFGSRNGVLHDANTFFQKPVAYYPFKFGNHTLFNIGYFLRVKMHLSYFNANLLLSLLSFYGLFLLLKCASKVYNNSQNKKLNNYYFVLFFFPSFHFWSIGFAKETFVFFSICYLCYKIFHNKKISFLSLIIILIPAIFIRPHYVVFFAATIFIYNLLISDYKKNELIKFSPIFIGAFYFSFISLDIENFSIQSLFDFIEVRRLENFSQIMEFDINQFNYLELTMRFIFFPNILNIFSINIFSIQPIILIENTILLFLTAGVIAKHFKINNFTEKRIYILFTLMIIFSFSASLITANMGIIFRYKNLIYPIFIVIFFITNSYKTKNRLNFKSYKNL